MNENNNDLKTQFFATLFGSDLRWSPTPARYCEAFQKLGVHATYIPCQIPAEQLQVFQDVLTSFITGVDNFLGAHITMPFKKHLVSFWPYEISPAVKATSAANIVYKNTQTGHWGLDNLDVFGVQQTLNQLVPQFCPSGPYNVLMLGAGGAAAAAAYALAQEPQVQRVFIHTRSVNTAENGAVFTGPSHFRLGGLGDSELQTTWSFLQTSGLPCLVINALPLGRLASVAGGTVVSNGAGQKPGNPYALETLRILHSTLGQRVGYFDMIYDPTEPLNLAQQLGIPYEDGQLMLSSQTAQSLKLWIS